jgi:hypothetical protein
MPSQAVPVNGLGAQRFVPRTRTTVKMIRTPEPRPRAGQVSVDLSQARLKRVRLARAPDLLLDRLPPQGGLAVRADGCSRTRPPVGRPQDVEVSESCGKDGELG